MLANRCGLLFYQGRLDVNQKEAPTPFFHPADTVASNNFSMGCVAYGPFWPGNWVSRQAFLCTVSLLGDGTL
jgi:hypothetical protein